MRELQLALDFVKLSNALNLLMKVNKYFDRIEIGTPLIKSEGMNAVKKIKEEYPDKVIIADMKTADTGALESGIAFNAGADVTTILSTAHDLTISESVKLAVKENKKIMVDLIHEKDISLRVKKLKELGVHEVCGFEWWCKGLVGLVSSGRDGGIQ